MPSAAAGRLMPDLPAGFRFHPTDEELIVHYLMNQAASIPCPVPIIAEVNIYQCNPWDLPAKALFGENEWYFFSPRDRKYPNGARPNRAAGSGYWKATGTDKAILSAPPTGESVGIKKALVFYSGKPTKGVKTDWIMHEYRLTATAATDKSANKRRRSSMRLDDWVLCRIYKKSNDFFQLSDQEQEGSSTVEEDSGLTNNVVNTAALASASTPKSETLDHDQFRQTQTAAMTATMSKSCSLTDLLNTIDCAALSQMLLLDGPAAGEADEPPLIYYPTTTIHTHTHQQQALNNHNNNNNNNNNNVMMNSSSHFIDNLPPRVDACSSDYVANNCNGLTMKRNKRTMVTMDAGAGPSFDDGSSSSAFSKKLKLLPSDSRSSHGHHLVGSSTSGYCNQLLVDTSSGFQFQSSSLMMGYPFLEMQ